MYLIAKDKEALGWEVGKGYSNQIELKKKKKPGIVILVFHKLDVQTKVKETKIM